MSVDDVALEKLITSVFLEMMNKEGKNQEGKSPVGSGIHDTIDQAVRAARKAQPRFVALPLDKRKAIIQAIRDVTLANNKEWAAAAVAETGLGRVEDKLQENILAASKTPGLEDLEATAVSGDKGLTLTEYAPFGVIGSLTPVTNPTGTLIHNTISMIAGGNTIVFNPHPSAVGICGTVTSAFHKAIVENGGPEGVVGMIKQPNMDSARALMAHPGIDFLVATGGKPVVHAVLSSGKKAIGAGAGNPPVLVDETASIRKAAQEIISGHSINNNIFCIAEKEVIAVDEIAGTLLKFMAETGKAAVLTEQQAEIITKTVVKEDGHINGAFIGKDISIILKAAGLNELAANTNLRCVVFEAKRDHPLVWLEQMMPVLPLVRVKDVWEGIDLAVEVEQGNRHTAMMHSVNVEHLTAFARAVQTTIFVKNGPSYAGIGLNGEGRSTFTIAGPTGEGLTSARSFCRQRRCVLIDGFRII
jgi:propionaldehyde dehydrogenase